jgi:hypothetical protein
MKFLMKIKFVGKGSTDNRVEQYEFNQFKNLLKKDKSLRNNFVSLVKNSAVECTSEELPKVFTVMVNLLGEDLPGLDEVYEVLVQRAAHLAGECRTEEFSEFFIKTNWWLGGILNTAKELASHCTKENFSKVFSKLKMDLGEGLASEWTGPDGARETFVQRAIQLAEKCDPNDWPGSFAGVEAALGGKDSPEWQRVEAAYLATHPKH